MLTWFNQMVLHVKDWDAYEELMNDLRWWRRRSFIYNNEFFKAP